MAPASVGGRGDFDLMFERWHDLGGKEFKLFADDALRRANDRPYVDFLQPRIALLNRLDLLNDHLWRSHEPGASRDRLFERREPGGARPFGIRQGRYLRLREAAYKPQRAEHFHVFLEIGARLFDGLLFGFSNVDTE